MARNKNHIPWYVIDSRLRDARDETILFMVVNIYQFTAGLTFRDFDAFHPFTENKRIY